MQTFWIRRSQKEAFETMINIFANGLAINPDISKRINELMEDYLELCLPGTREAKHKSDKEFIDKSAQTLKDVATLLANNYKGNMF